MIGKLKGLVDQIDEDGLIVDVGGVGYLVAASARTLRALPALGQPVTLHIETQVREDSLRLFGFLTLAERDWFRLLQSVQGVGAKVALGILGALSGEALSAAIARQDKAMMARAPGVGPKLAARLVLELKDKSPAPGVDDLGGVIGAAEPGSKLPKAAEDAVLALVGLGYARPQAAAAVAKGFAALGAEAATAALIRAGLKELAQYVVFAIMVASRKGEIAMSVVTLNSKYQLISQRNYGTECRGGRGRNSPLSSSRRLKLVPVPKREELAGIAKGADFGEYRDRNDRF